MTTPFFIAALPRSRTAWLANYLTWDRCFCFHDGLASGVESLAEKLGGQPASWVGNSDAGNILYEPQLRRLYPAAKWVVVRRPLDEVVKSCEAVVGGRFNLGTLHASSKELDRLSRESGVLTVEFDEIDRRCREIAEFVCPGWQCPEERTAQLLKTNVQAHAGRVIHDAAANWDGLRRMMSEVRGGKTADRPSPDQAAYLRAAYPACAGNAEAWSFLNEAIDAALLWDHLVDGQRFGAGHVDRVFKALTTAWPLNGFVRQHAASLVPVLVNSVAAWKFSNEPMENKMKAYDLYTELPTTIAWILGGHELVERVGPEIRRRAYAALRADEIEDGGAK